MQLQTIQNKIYELRGQQVMLDFDLAELYGVPTKHLKQAVKRNAKRFPHDFAFVLEREEVRGLRSQFVTSNKGRGGTRYAPLVFTEQGVAMLSSVLNSDTAIEVNIAIMRAFVLMRQFALSHKDLTDRLNELEKKYDQKFTTIHEALTYLLQKDTEETERRHERQTRRRIGFHKEEEI